ncbi:MAG: energy transducer TonB [Bacteroidia bacterium]|nr:energy transducer TonB [Bacteroidia bacterium]NNL79381.1 hypothetical protein [Flavobacteriaceae bacterium]
MIQLNDSNKALIITILLSATVVLMTFNVHLKKKNELIAETYFEILPDEEEEQEELADILKSLDEVITTNKAFNETKQYDDFEDEEFKNTLEKIRNRDAREIEPVKDTDQSSSSDENLEDLASYENINSVIAKRSQEDRSAASNIDGQIKNSTVSFSLVDREAEYLPPPIYLCERGGKIVISIEVDAKGNVVSAQYNNASGSKNQCLIDHAIEYAKESKFNPDGRRSEQLGTITFMFQGKL